MRYTYAALHVHTENDINIINSLSPTCGVQVAYLKAPQHKHSARRLIIRKHKHTSVAEQNTPEQHPRALLRFSAVVSWRSSRHKTLRHFCLSAGGAVRPLHWALLSYVAISALTWDFIWRKCEAKQTAIIVGAVSFDTWVLKYLSVTSVLSRRCFH